MFKVNNNKNTRTTYFTPFSSVSIVDFEQVNVRWVIAFFKHCRIALTHFMPLVPIYTSENLKKQRFSDIFRGHKKGSLA